VNGGAISTINGTGHALNVNSGQISSFSLSGATYTLNGDGTASASLGSANSFLSGYKNIMISADGNIILGGSIVAGSQDFLIGVRAYSGTAALANWSGLYYTGGLRYDARNATSAGYVGAANAIPSLAVVSNYQREHQIGVVAFDYTGYLATTLNSNGTYSDGPLNLLGLGTNGKMFTDADLASTADTEGFSIDFGIAANTFSGTGVYINPNGVLNGASFSPFGQPIAPGEFITIFGTGLAATETVATAPYPTSLGGVSVTINSLPVPVYLASPTQLNILVPYEVSGTAASIVVTNNGQASNTVVVPLSTTAPGIFTQNSSGTGPAAIRHSNNSLVTSANPAKLGETVSIYLTGLGAVNPTVSNGTAGGSNPLSNTVEAVAVIIGNVTATVSYAGLAPGLPGLYQINVTIPTSLVGTGAVGIAIQTTEGFAEQSTIAIQ
jgi:uncharacterized protein (TIGR03437 family)